MFWKAEGAYPRSNCWTSKLLWQIIFHSWHSPYSLIMTLWNSQMSSLPLSGRLVTSPWYWEYHWVEFSVPASVENLELSVPTGLVLTFCIEKSLICIRMLHNCTLCCSSRYKPKPPKPFSKALCSQEPVLLRRKMGKVDFPQTSWRHQNQARRAEAFEKKNQENIMYLYCGS